eukprot:TRINITY_DN2640_c0_g1_i1.p1 TRINITY_DN2640_c0_g1~~TRINITY_DN2640_c0_g1_i1.p1  ORF type:complete len:530 (+),score=196.31 TRINITY_DN2640_c0_g1_i1:129-1592(+)
MRRKRREMSEKETKENVTTKITNVTEKFENIQEEKETTPLRIETRKTNFVEKEKEIEEIIETVNTMEKKMESSFITIGAAICIGIAGMIYLIYNQVSQIMYMRRKRREMSEKETKENVTTKITNVTEKFENIQEEKETTPLRIETRKTNFVVEKEKEIEEIIETVNTMSALPLIEELNVVVQNQIVVEEVKPVQERIHTEKTQEEESFEVNMNTSFTEIPKPKLRFTENRLTDFKNKFDSLSEKLEEKINNNYYTPQIEKTNSMKYTFTTIKQHNDSLDDIESSIDEDFPHELHPSAPITTEKNLFRLFAQDENYGEMPSNDSPSRIKESIIDESEKVSNKVTISDKIIEELDSDEDSDFNEKVEEEKEKQQSEEEEEEDVISSEVDEKEESEEEELKKRKTKATKKDSSRRKTVSAFIEPETPPQRKKTTSASAKKKSSKDKENISSNSKSSRHSISSSTQTPNSSRVLRDRKSIKTPRRQDYEYY